MLRRQQDQAAHEQPNAKRWHENLPAAKKWGRLSHHDRFTGGRLRL